MFKNIGIYCLLLVGPFSWAEATLTEQAEDRRVESEIREAVSLLGLEGSEPWCSLLIADKNRLAVPFGKSVVPESLEAIRGELENVEREYQASRGWFLGFRWNTSASEEQVSKKKHLVAVHNAVLTLDRAFAYIENLDHYTRNFFEEYGPVPSEDDSLPSEAALFTQERAFEVFLEKFEVEIQKFAVVAGVLSSELEFADIDADEMESAAASVVAAVSKLGLELGYIEKLIEASSPHFSEYRARQMSLSKFSDELLDD